MTFSKTGKMDFTFQDFNDQYGSGVYAIWMYDDEDSYFAEASLNGASHPSAWTLYGEYSDEEREQICEKLAHDYTNWLINCVKARGYNA